MFIRTSRVTRGDKTYEYLQLVESYRLPGGPPRHKVLANLSKWTPEAVALLRQLIDAKKQGVALVLPAEALKETAPVEWHRAILTLEYLPIAVLSDIWKNLGISELLDALLPSSSITAHSTIIQALVLHRCLAPGSKLDACAWFPSTALPELLGLRQRFFNNSRVHRGLSALSDAEDKVQHALSRLASLEGEGLRLAFLDLTDTYFVGRGPELSRKGKTKEGLLREKIDIALLCDQRGFPMSWLTTEGGRYEPRVMMEVLERARQSGTLKTEPVVMDRAMGRGVHLEGLSDASISFVTALVRPAFRSFVDDGPWERAGSLEVSGSAGARKREVHRLEQFALEQGMTKLEDGRFVLDLGVERCQRDASRPAPDGTGPIAALFREVSFMNDAAERGAMNKTLAAWYHVHPSVIGRYRRLNRLSPEIWSAALDGGAEGIFLKELRQIGELPRAEQLPAFHQAQERSEGRERAKPPAILDLIRSSFLIRRVVTFSPDLLIGRRRRFEERRERLGARVQQLNQEQRERRRPRPDVHMLADIRTYLNKLNWLNLFTVTVVQRRHDGRLHGELVLELNEQEWKRRRKLDGFGVLVAHPRVLMSPRDLVKAYFAKDIVEKDFKIIKSELEIRPVHHRTDPKIRAHVSLCMLALLLERTLEQRLTMAGLQLTAAAAISILRTCHLSLLKPPVGAPYYTITRPTDEQQRILDALGLGRLTNDLEVGKRLSHR